jgi:hypothetical protein
MDRHATQFGRRGRLRIHRCGSRCHQPVQAQTSAEQIIVSAMLGDPAVEDDLVSVAVIVRGGLLTAHQQQGQGKRGDSAHGSVSPRKGNRNQA